MPADTGAAVCSTRQIPICMVGDIDERVGISFGSVFDSNAVMRIKRIASGCLEAAGVPFMTIWLMGGEDDPYAVGRTR